MTGESRFVEAAPAQLLKYLKIIAKYISVDNL